MRLCFCGTSNLRRIHGYKFLIQNGWILLTGQEIVVSIQLQERHVNMHWIV
ncbi:hypothetical protein ACFX2H_028923 [Malus domestica]